MLYDFRAVLGQIDGIEMTVLTMLADIRRIKEKLLVNIEKIEKERKKDESQVFSKL